MSTTEYAFPGLPQPMADASGAICGFSGNGLGMTLRDYFAIHCDQPGRHEILTAAGRKSKDGYRISTGSVNSQEMFITFDEWWAGLPNSTRFDLYAKVRWQMADALLAARSDTPTTPSQER